MSVIQPSKKQRELFNFIDSFIANHGYSPSYREIMRALNYKSISTVAIHIDNLIVKGYVKKKDHSARSLEVCHSTEPQLLASRPITPSEEKWLVDLIGAHFKTIEQKKPEVGKIDQLYVLVGALHILGFEDAARSFKSKLLNLDRRQ